MALSVEHVEIYLKDIIFSAITFFIVIGPVIKTEMEERQRKKEEERGEDRVGKPDKVVSLLKELKEEQALQGKRDRGEKITFEDYEAMMDEIERRQSKKL